MSVATIKKKLNKVETFKHPRIATGTVYEWEDKHLLWVDQKVSMIWRENMNNISIARKQDLAGLLLYEPMVAQARDAGVTKVLFHFEELERVYLTDLENFTNSKIYKMRSIRNKVFRLVMADKFIVHTVDAYEQSGVFI